MTTTLEARPAEVALPTQPASQAVPEPPPTTRPRWYDRRWSGLVAVLVVAGLAGWAFTRGIGTPWPWSDEGATYLALQRTYSQMLTLYQGPDAPLVPYYLLAKAWTQALQFLWPLMPTLTAVRLLSAAAGTLTVTALYGLAARNVGRLAGLLAAVLLVSLPGFDRLAQEGRGYTLLALAATVSWLMWDRWLRPGRRPRFWMAEQKETAPGEQTGLGALPAGGGYLASLAALGLIHTFGLFQWPAQLLATLATRPGRPWRRLSALWLTIAVLAIAAVAVSGQTLASLAHGTGSQSPNAARVVDLATIATQFTRGVFLTTSTPAITLVFVLATIGVIGTKRTRPFAVAMLIWLLVPLVMELGLAVVKTNLFRSRYWVADLPPLAALSGLGLMIVAQAVSGMLARPFRTAAAARNPAVTGVRALTALTVLAGVLALQGATQATEQTHLRAPTGHHGENLSSVMRLIDRTRTQYPHVRVLISSGPASGILGAARPELQTQNPLRMLDPTTTTVYTVPTSQTSARAAVRHSVPLLWIFRGVALDARTAAARIPHGLGGLHMHVRWAVPAGPSWTAILLQPGATSPPATSGSARG